MKHETYVELELDGPSDQTLGFIEGFRLALTGDRPAWFASRENVEIDSWIDAIRTTLDLERHVILPEDLATRVVSALERSETLKITVSSIRKIDHAELEVSYECYSPDEAKTIRQLIEEELPEDVRLEDYEPEEKILEDARGTELYSPVHNYTLKASGRYVGPTPGIIEMAHRLTDRDFIQTRKIVLHHTK